MPDQEGWPASPSDLPPPEPLLRAQTSCRLCTHRATFPLLPAPLPPPQLWMQWQPPPGGTISKLVRAALGFCWALGAPLGSRGFLHSPAWPLLQVTPQQAPKLQPTPSSPPTSSPRSPDANMDCWCWGVWQEGWHATSIVVLCSSLP